MGNFINPTKIVEGNTIKYKQDIINHNPYNTLIEGSPTKVLYYQVNKELTSWDENLFNIDELLGPESPVKFNKIDDAIVYNVDLLQGQIEMTESSGLKLSDINMTLTVPPDTFKPYLNDLLCIPYLDNTYFFKVINIQQDLLRNNPFYEITVKFSKIIEEGDEVPIYDNFRLIFQNIGTEFKSVLREEDFVNVEELKELFIHLGKDFTNLFYNVSVKNFIVPKTFDGDLGYVYFVDIIRFIMRHNLIEDKYPDLVDLSNQLDFAYDNTIYGYIENDKMVDSNMITSVSYEEIKGKFRPLAIYRYPVYSIITNVIKDTELFSSTFIDNIINNTTGSNVMDNIIINLFNKNAIDWKVALDSIQFNDNEEQYIKIPLILYGLKRDILNHYE